jgi:hypothetical protein
MWFDLTASGLIMVNVLFPAICFLISYKDAKVWNILEKTSAWRFLFQ